MPGGQATMGGPSGGGHSSLPYLPSLSGGVPTSLPVGGPSPPCMGAGLYRGGPPSLPGGGRGLPGLPGVGPSSLPFLTSQQQQGWQQNLHSSASSLDLQTSGVHAPSQLQSSQPQSSQPQWDRRHM